jgi:hypothetical protein
MRILLLGLVTMVVLAACGGGSSKPDEATLRANMEYFWTAFQKKDVSKLYSMLSEEQKKTCSLSDFTGTILLAHAFLGETLKDSKFEVRDIQIDGTKATFTSSITIDGEPLDDDGDTAEAEWNGKRWVTSDDTSCGDDDDVASSGSRTPTPAISPTPVTLKSTRETQGTTALTSGGLTISVTRLTVADYKEYYAAQDSATKRDLDFSDETNGAVTIGQIYLKVENKNSTRVSIFPDQGTVVIGSEQVEIDFFSSDDLGGEYFPGVVKEGKVSFFLKRTPAAQVTNVLYAVDSPFSTSPGGNDPDFEFKITVSPKNP